MQLGWIKNILNSITRIIALNYPIPWTRELRTGLYNIIKMASNLYSSTNQPRQQCSMQINLRCPYCKPLPHSVLLRHSLQAFALNTALVSSFGSLHDVIWGSSSSVCRLSKRWIARIYLLSPGVFRIGFLPTSLLVISLLFSASTLRSVG